MADRFVKGVRIILDAPGARKAWFYISVDTQYPVVQIKIARLDVDLDVMVTTSFNVEFEDKAKFIRVGRTFSYGGAGGRVYPFAERRREMEFDSAEECLAAAWDMLFE